MYKSGGDIGKLLSAVWEGGGGRVDCWGTVLGSFEGWLGSFQASSGSFRAVFVYAIHSSNGRILVWDLAGLGAALRLVSAVHQEGEGRV